MLVAHVTRACPAAARRRAGRPAFARGHRRSLPREESRRSLRDERCTRRRAGARAGRCQDGRSQPRRQRANAHLRDAGAIGVASGRRASGVHELTAGTAAATIASPAPLARSPNRPRTSCGREGIGGRCGNSGDVRPAGAARARTHRASGRAIVPADRDGVAPRRTARCRRSSSRTGPSSRQRVPWHRDPHYGGSDRRWGDAGARLRSRARPHPPRDR